MPKTARIAVLAGAAIVAACAMLPVGLDGPKATSQALQQPEATALGQTIQAQAKQHPGRSGFKLLVDGRDGLAARLEIAARAERTLDVQYFIVRADGTGRMVLAALLAAADRGVRVRLLIDDVYTSDRDSVLTPLAAHPNVEVRIFNPFLVGDGLPVLRGAEFLLAAPRLNGRMHNKLLIADNALAMVGGRNLADPYFLGGESATEFGDLDLLVAGPIVRELSQSFDTFWNSRPAVPSEALGAAPPGAADLDRIRTELARAPEQENVRAFARDAAQRRPVASALRGERPLIWARAELCYDDPEKTDAKTIDASTERPGSRPPRNRILAAASAARSELLLVSPYVVPLPDEVALLRDLHDRGVRVRMLTNSLASTDMVPAHAGYQRYRVPLLEAGTELHEVRLPYRQAEAKGKPAGANGESPDAQDKHGLALHAKAFIFDRKRVFVGSMNFDRRSLHFNTELGLLIESPELASALARRFDAIASSANSWSVVLERSADSGRAVRWIGERDGRVVRYDEEPEADFDRRLQAGLISLLPLDDLL